MTKFKYIIIALAAVMLSFTNISAKHKGRKDIESGLKDRNDIVFFTDFETENWNKDWDGFSHKQNYRLVNARSSALLNSDFSGKALEIVIKEGQHYGMTGKFRFQKQLGYEPEELYVRFYTYFAEDFTNRDGQVGYTGKGPGFDGTYGRVGWGGRPNKDGTRGWSCRGAHFANSDDGKVKVGFYAYEVQKGKSIYGQTLNFNQPLKTGRWYCVEQYMKLNTPGKKDGIARGWIDGKPVFEKTDYLWRNTDKLKIYSYWIDYYRGGKEPANHDHHVYLDNFVIATDKRVGLFKKE